MHASAVVSAYTSGLSIRAIAGTSSLSRAEVSTILAEAGVAIRGKPVLDFSSAQWAALLQEAGSVRELGRRLHRHPVTIYNYLRRHSVILPTGAAAIGTSAWWDERTERVGECEVWNRAHTVDGFARTSRDGQQLHAHRVRWQEQHGEVPPGYEILHISPCIRKDCVRLEHLRAQPVITRLAVQAQDGVFPRGERHWNSKLEEEQARAILVSREPTTVLARRFHVSRATVIAIRKGYRWGHLSRVE